METSFAVATTKTCFLHSCIQNRNCPTILVDTPPMGNLIDGAVVAKQCDGPILVVGRELVSRKVAAKAKEQLEKSGCRMLGAVLNKVDVRKDRYYSKYNSKYSYYSSGNTK